MLLSDPHHGENIQRHSQSAGLHFCDLYSRNINISWNRSMILIWDNCFFFFFHLEDVSWIRCHIFRNSSLALMLFEAIKQLFFLFIFSLIAFSARACHLQRDKNVYFFLKKVFISILSQLIFLVYQILPISVKSSGINDYRNN